MFDWVNPNADWLVRLTADGLRIVSAALLALSAAGAITVVLSWWQVHKRT